MADIKVLRKAVIINLYTAMPTEAEYVLPQ